MEYFIKRGEERFGPYNLAELQQYVQSGNILLGDMTQSEGMGDWVPVSQVLGNIPAAVPVVADASAFAPIEERIPLPPNLPWWALLIVSTVTLGFFNFIWAMVQANWARKLSGSNKPLVLVAMYPASIIAGILTAMVSREAVAIGAVLRLAGWIMLVVGNFSIKSAMEGYYNSKENIGLRLSGVMTFFFNSLYLQYHINQLHSMKKRGLLQ